MTKDKRHFRLLHKAALVWKSLGVLTIPAYGFMKDGKKHGTFEWHGDHGWQVSHDYEWQDYCDRAKDLMRSKSLTWNALLVPQAINRLLVTDLDSYKTNNDGEILLSMVPDNHWHQLSGRGGRHDFWRAEAAIGHGALEGLSGVDVLTKTFVFSFGTCLQGGLPYSLKVPGMVESSAPSDVEPIQDLSPETVGAFRELLPIQDLPPRLKDLLKASVKPQRHFGPCRRTDAVVASAEDILSSSMVPGMRHDALLTAAGKLSYAGYTEEMITGTLLEWNRSNGSPKQERELESIARYVCLT